MCDCLICSVYILEKQAYIRLLDLSGLEMNVSQLLKLDKTIVVKNAINSLRSNATVGAYFKITLHSTLFSTTESFSHSISLLA